MSVGHGKKSVLYKSISLVVEYYSSCFCLIKQYMFLTLVIKLLTLSLLFKLL